MRRDRSAELARFGMALVLDQTWTFLFGFVSEGALLVPQDHEEDRRGQDERDHGYGDVRGWNIDLHARLLCPLLLGLTVHFGALRVVHAERDPLRGGTNGRGVEHVQGA